MTDSYSYNWQGLRTRATFDGVARRYVYHGDRVLEELNDAGGTLARYTTESGSYYEPVWHMQRWTGESRFPMYDGIGSVRGLVNQMGTVTDTYEMDAFGVAIAGAGGTENPYRLGGAWGYLTDPSGMLQLGARFYWPEVGRFVQQDPAKEPPSAYVYALNQPLSAADPDGQSWWKPVDIACAKQVYEFAGKEAKRSGLPGRHNGPADAYRHCVASCQTARTCGQRTAFAGGHWVEVRGLPSWHIGQQRQEARMDYHNNKVGRGLASCPESCASACRKALD